jgi:hypothetical protein
MSTSNVISHPRFAAVPVKNPPMRPGPKPKGTSGYYAARGRRDRERRLRALEQEQARKAGEYPNLDAARRLSEALKLLDIDKLKRLVAEAGKLVREYRADY